MGCHFTKQLEGVPASPTIFFLARARCFSAGSGDRGCVHPLFRPTFARGLYGRAAGERCRRGSGGGEEGGEGCRRGSRGGERGGRGRGVGVAGAFGFADCLVFLARARCLSAGLRYLRLTRLPRHDRGPVPGGDRSAASCLCTVLRRALYHYATRSPVPASPTKL